MPSVEVRTVKQRIGRTAVSLRFHACAKDLTLFLFNEGAREDIGKTVLAHPIIID